MERMYMIEVLVLKVTFAELPVPLKKDVVIQATCGSVVSLEMHTDIMGATANLETKERSSKKKDMDIDCGRSVVFPITVSDMVKLLTNCPMEVSVYSKRQDQPLGTVMIPWHSDFLELVNASQQSGGYITPVAIEQEFEMTKEQTKYGGLINIFIRLTALGRTIYTNIQRTVNKDSTGAPDALGATYLFKSSDNATVFKCQRYGSGSDSDLVNAAPLYNMANRSEGGAGGTFTGGGVPVVSGKRARGTTKSTETLLTMQSGMLSSMSMTPSVFMIMGPQDRVALRNRMLSADSIQSMMSVGNLKGKRYMDLTELHNDVSMFSTFANAFGMSMFVFDDDDQEGEDGDMALNFEPVFIDYKALTKSEIEKRLCKHPDCPAARLFKDYGIGPLAKNFRGTGGMYNDVDPPLTYGMSHCNGTIEGYGPLGKFRKPRNPEDPFTPLKGCKCKDKVLINMKEAPYSSGTSSSSSRCSSTSSCTSSKKSACYTHCPMAAHKITKIPQSSVGNTEPLRLRGGGPIECDPNPPSTCPPDPNLLCQDLMNEFNKVLQEYKDALGPCGQATCAFALNITREECQRVCKAKFDTVNTDTCELADSEVVLVEKEEFAGCGVPSCPYKRAAISPAEKDFSKYKGVPGCGNTDCPFIKAKLGMEPEEDKHLPAFKDYQTQKTYKYDHKLPPIHWDCPDPLPKGDCKNPDCPFVKRDALIKKYFPEPCCPCGNPACPYVCAPCTFPGCPFTMADPCPPVCPYTEPPPKELKCTPSVCPLVRLTETECKNPCCPYRQYEEKVEECARRMRLAAEMKEEEAEGENSVCTPCGRIRKQSKLRLKSNSRSRTKTSTSRMRTLETCASTFDDNAEGISCEEECVLSAPACLRTEESKHACDFSKGSEGSSKKGSSNFKTCSKDKNSKNSSDSSSSKQEANKTVSIKEVFDSKTKPLNDSISEKTDEGKLSVKNVSYEKKFKLTLEEEISKMCRKRKFRFDSKSFKPCNKIGHRNCVLPMFNVPKNMGWLWNIHNDYCGLRPRRGWKPGAVSKLLALRMDYFNSIRENRPITIGVMSKSALPASPPKPTVTIQKKKGVINVTMLPIKDPTEVRKQGDGNPYLECTPLQFRITKNEVEKEKEKRVCFCGDEISDTSSSELDIEFSPPGGLVNPRLINHAQPVEMEVQYNINDIPIPEPLPPKKGFTRFKSFSLEESKRLVKLISHWNLIEFIKQFELPPIASDTIIPYYPTGTLSVMSRVLWNLFTHFVHCKVNDNGYTVKLVFLKLNVLFNEKKLADCKLCQSTIIEPDRDKSHGLVQSSPPILRLRGGGFENDAQKQVYVHKMKLYPLGLRGGMRSNNNIGPVKIEPRRVPDAIGMCRDLLDDFDKLRNDYKKALGPCGLATCPMNFNVLEAQCRPICPEPLPAILCEEAYCPPAKPPTPAMPQYSVGCEGEDEQTTDPFTPCMHNCGSLYGNKPCGRPECPFGSSTCKDLSECDDAYQKTTQNTSDVRMSSKDSAEAMKKSAIKCNRHICPYAEELPTVDQAKQVIKPIKSRRGCGSPYCPHSTPYCMEVPEVDIPRFPCKNPCPSTEELPPIHWDCPDPLPIGECSNPYCPLREKPPCSHCPISAKHCGYPGCPFADKETCPPTCPYILSKPPKHLECTPSVCVLARTAEYRPTSVRTRKGPAKVCNDRCPYNKDKTVKKSCGNPKCPYRTCADGDSNSMDSICSSPECPYRVERHRQEEREKKKEEKEKSSLRTLNNVEGVTPALGHLQTTSKSCDEVIRTQTISGLPRTTSFLPTTTSGMEPSTHNDVSSNTTKLTRQPSQRSTLLKMFKRSMLSFENAKKGNASAADSCRDEICLLMEKKMCKKCQRIAERGASVEFGSKSKMNKNKKSIKKKKKKKSFGYVYNKGTYYPGVNFGHKECNICSNRVPWDMGWMWNVQQPYFPLKLRKGWRPGAIGKTILKAVNARRKELGLLPRPQIKNPIPHIKRNIDGHTMTASRSRARMDEKTINLDPKPTLSVKKKDGIVYVTMNPLKDPKLMDEGEYPYIDCSPLQFRIIKKKDNAFKNCLCGTGDGNEDDMLSDKSSELDIEFTTPAGLMRPEMKNRQKNLVHIDTQYDEGDIPRDPEEEMPEVKKKKGKSEKKAKSKKSKK